MVRQFLLRPDGSIPPGTNVAALEAAGVIFVVPTPVPRPSVGMVVKEGAPAQEGDVWRQTWVEEPEPPPAPKPIPAKVTMRQARLILLQAGLLDQVEGAIAAIENPVERRAAEITWEYSIEVERTNPLVTRLSTVFGLTDEQVNDMFRQAAKL
jgi:hypothetical protein